MSKRNRGRRVTRPVQKQPEKQPEKKSHLIVPLLATDGYINRLAYLGEASLLQEGSDYERHSITRDYELLTVMYRENWIAKRIIDTPCEDMTRSWYSISSALNQDRIDEIVQLEAKHNIKQEITNGLRWARLFGGAAAVMVIKGQEDMLDQPLNYDEMMPGCFRGLIVVDRTSGLDPSVELEEDMDDPEFGYPKWYTVRLDNESTMRVHHSRMLLFRGRMLPIQEEISESFWGASELEHVYEELQKRNATSANIAQLVFQANVGVLKMADYGEIMGMGTDAQREQIVNAIYDQNRIRNSFGMMIMGNDDGYEQHPYSFSGLSEVYESFMMDMAGAAEIPATKLYGRSPQGMNATGESDMKNYYEMLAQLQERNLRPAIDKLLPVMCMSLWGKIPNDLDIVFEPLQITTPAERAQITSQVTGVVIQAFSAGLISQQTALEELQKAGKDIGSWTSITDELIENAESEVDQGEGMQDPMGGMGGGMPGMPGMPGAPGGEGGEEAPPEAGGMPGGEEAGMMPPGAEGQAEPPQEAPDESETAPESQEDRVIAKLKKAVQGGSEAKGQGSAEKEEAKDDGSLNTRRIAVIKRHIVKAAKKGDIDSAREMVKRYRAALAGAEEKKPSLRKRIMSIFRRSGHDEEAWRTNEEGRHFKLETETGEIKAGFGGRFNGKKIGEQWNSGSKPRASGGRVAAPPKVKVEQKGKSVPVTFNTTRSGTTKSESFAKETQARFEESRKEAESVFNNPGSSQDERDEALNYLASMALSSDAAYAAERGDIPATSEFGFKGAPKEWAERLTPTEQQVLAAISSETEDLDYINAVSWEKNNPEANDAMKKLQAKFLGAELDVPLSDNLLEKYVGIEKREEVPGQQSMFWGENVPQNPKFAEKNPDSGYDLRYNGSGSSGSAAPVPGMKKVSPKQFRETFHAAKDAVAKNRPEDAWRVDGSYTEADYAGMDCYVSEGGSAVAVHNGDIVSVCAAPGDSIRGKQLLQHAFAMGGNKCDAFGGLYGFYIKHGLEPVSWCEFADVEGIRPPDWDRKRDNKEPVIFFKRTGRTQAEIESQYGADQYEFMKRVRVSGDYDAAKAIRDESMRGQ